MRNLVDASYISKNNENQKTTYHDKKSIAIKLNYMVDSESPL
jgi:hypothetical protein